MNELWAAGPARCVCNIKLMLFKSGPEHPPRGKVVHLRLHLETTVGQPSESVFGTFCFCSKLPQLSQAHLHQGRLSRLYPWASGASKGKNLRVRLCLPPLGWAWFAPTCVWIEVTGGR